MPIYVAPLCALLCSKPILEVVHKMECTVDKWLVYTCKCCMADW